MPEDPKTPGNFIERKQPAHLPLLNAPRAGNVIWLTICANSPRVRFDRDDIHTLLVSIWSAEHSQWLVGDYVLMPDHIHLFTAPRFVDALPLKNWMKWWHQQASKSWPRKEEAPLWQRDYWDRQLRHDESYLEKWHYLRHNPVRSGLVSHPDLWPYQGRIHPLQLS
jgi:REP element-mobilizing transposase RayT